MLAEPETSAALSPVRRPVTERANLSMIAEAGTPGPSSTADAVPLLPVSRGTGRRLP